MIRIGTSGFSYDDWKGRFYPARTRREEMLSFYARSFVTVEINTTFYRIPGPGLLADLARRTPAGFDFVVKVHQSLTHTPEPDPEAFGAVRAAVAPLAEAGKLGALLAQFPHSFRRSRAAELRLAELRREFPVGPLVVEFRHAGWAQERTFALLRDLDIGFCCVDEPALDGLMPPVARATADIGYVRFHGRNAAKWFNHDQAHERYEYHYSPAELSEWVDPVLRLETETERTYALFNNHYLGNAAENARDLARLLGQILPDPEPLQPTLDLE